MKKQRFTEEQIIAVLKEQEAGAKAAKALEDENAKLKKLLDCRANTAKALRMLLDTITALQSANDHALDS
ncbi:cell shape-determining protein MreC [Rhizobium sp. BK650]|nr:cell shape-determining protein MreC [Rhizobium sp. BK650]